MENFIPTFEKHPEERCEMEISEKDVAVTPDPDNLLGLLSDVFYPQNKWLKIGDEIKHVSFLLSLDLNESDKYPG